MKPGTRAPQTGRTGRARRPRRKAARRALPVVAAALLLAACAPGIPDSGRGVGFGAYPEPRPGAGDAAAAVPLVSGGEISGETISPGLDLPTSAPAPRMADGASGPQAQVPAGAAAGAPPAADPPAPEAGTGTAQAAGGRSVPAAAVPAGTVPIAPDNPGLSDEQDFDAVSARETIESDRARLEAQRRAYQLIRPKPLPPRPKRSLALIVDYALSTNNRVGQPLYRRVGLFSRERFERNCAKYPSSDQAQEAFLRAGGPKRDRYGLDPDGDGFACYWDPEPFRMAVRSGGEAGQEPEGGGQ